MAKKIFILVFLCIGLTASLSAQNDKPSPGGHPGPEDPRKEAVDAKKGKQKIRYVSDIVDAHEMYLYGIAYSPVDSVVYFTDEMSLDGAQIHLRTKFLVARNELSSQLRNHMVFEGEKNRTCCVVFSQDSKKLDKKYLKQVEYYKKRGYLVKFINSDRFQFKAVRTEYTDEGYAIEEKEVSVE